MTTKTAPKTATPTTTVEIHKGQRLALESKKRFTLMFAGSGSGKTTAGAIWLVQQIQKYWDEPPEGQVYIVVAPITDLLKASLMALTPFLEQMGDGSGDEKNGYRKANKEWHLASGGIIRFRSADSPKGLEAIHARAAWLDEGCQLPEDAWYTIVRRVAFFQGQVLVTSTYYAPTPDWVITAVENDQAGTDPDTAVIAFPSNWNPAYPQDEWERLKRTLPPEEFAMFYESKLVKPAGVVYSNWDPQLHIVEPFPLGTPLYSGVDAQGEPVPMLDEQGNPKYDWWPVFAGLDSGDAVPSALLYAAIDPEGRAFIFRELYAPNLLSGAIADHINETEPRPQRVYCDPAAASVRRELRNRDVPVVPADNSVADGISCVYQRIGSGKLFVFKGAAPNLVKELPRYRRSKEGHIVKVDDHACDSLRYLCQGLKRYSSNVIALWV